MARRQRKSEISIPFNFTKPEDILSGRKTATRRATGYGAKPGDTLLAGMGLSYASWVSLP